MNAKFSKIMSYLAVAIVLYFAFSVHILLGIAAIVAIIGWLIYNKRDAMVAQRAMIENNKGNRKDALLLLEKAHRMNPNNPVTASNYAYLALKDGQADKADELLSRILANKQLPDQTRTSAMITFALVRWKQGNLAEAIAMLEGIQAKIRTTVLYGSLGYFYIEQGDLDQALAYNLEAVDYNDTDAIIMDNLYLTYILREEWELADQTGEKLMGLSPKFPEAYYHDGLLKLHQGDNAGALERFNEALDKPFSAVSTESKETVERKRDETAALVGDASDEPAADETASDEA